MTCPMKQFFSYLGASLAAIAALASCNKEIEAPVEDLKGGVPFEICASAGDTKTTIDGLATSWVADDAINLFHAVAGSKNYTSDGKFTITSENLATNKFTGTLTAALEAGNYDWYALYPYSMDVTTPASTSSGYVTVGGTSQTQTGNNSTAHLCGESCPLYGVAKAVASDVAPSIVMNHLASIIEVNVTNNSPKALAVSSVSFTGTEDIVGTYYIDFTQNPAVYTSRGESYVSKTASLSVTGGEDIATGSSAKFYIAIKPFTVSSGTLKVAVNGAEKEITISNETVFAAGKIKKINFNVDYVTIPWTEDFSGKLDKYSLVNGETETKTYDANLARGTKPELLVSNTNGSFSAKVQASAGKYALTFKSNHADYLSISVDKDAITLNKLSDTEYTLVIPEGIDFFNITFTNTNSGSNTRLDDISLKDDKRTPLSTPEVIALLNSNTPNSIDVMWDAVLNAGSYVVTATPEKGTAVSKTVTADAETDTYKYTITGLNYETTYTISVVAKSSDTSLYFDSKSGVAEEPVKTGVKPTTGEDPVTYTALFGSSYNSKSVQNYTTTWSATNAGFTVDLVNWNNSQNNWSYIKAGSKSSASVATITTNAAISEAITKVSITIDAVTAKSINSITLYCGDKADACTTSLGTFTIAAGEQSVTITSPTVNKFYKISADCKKASNGTLTVSKVVYTKE